ncbi:MAG TPA: hypothetical protein VE907_06330 [Gammaproteobacteria bacterium]|nr:hypothetical protein [Gammaproteobacteria bacterium]
MKIAVILENAPDVEFCREEFEVADDHEDFNDAVDEAATKIVEGWILSVGDRIKIVELEGDASLVNRAMARKLAIGAAVDVAGFERLGPYYVVPKAQAIDVDFCDASREAWIWSIGRAERPFTFKHADTSYVVPVGMVLASLWNDMYQREGVECLWLR